MRRQGRPAGEVIERWHAQLGIVEGRRMQTSQQRAYSLLRLLAHWFLTFLFLYSARLSMAQTLLLVAVFGTTSSVFARKLVSRRAR